MMREVANPAMRIPAIILPVDVPAKKQQTSVVVVDREPGEARTIQSISIIKV